MTYLRAVALVVTLTLLSFFAIISISSFIMRAVALLVTLTLLSGLSTTHMGAILLILVSALGILLVLHGYCRAKSSGPTPTPRFIPRPPAPSKESRYRWLATRPGEERFVVVSPRPLKRVGYWWSPEEPNLPHPRDYVDTAWDAGERRRVIAYLGDCYHLRKYCGYSSCRFGCSNYLDMGTSDLTDGTWLFPEGLVHYVRHHALKPPQDFLEHMRKGGFRVPELAEGFVPLNSLRASLSDAANEKAGRLDRYIQRLRAPAPPQDSG
jgi:hypothetical protein